MLLVLFPVFLIVAVALKADSRGPVVIGLRRLGKNGQEFRCFKFRTMTVNDAQMQIEKALGPQGDARITRLGRLLRIAGIDELPSLVSVIRGDMSLVGPRPALLLELDRYSDLERRRLDVLPGVTGYWQAFGRRGETDYVQMLAMDLEYVEQRSLLLDLRILARAATALLTRRSWY
jgi:lipopolysaccharide/colanic/teichoic acid biosynthesis glycosyltransferase